MEAADRTTLILTETTPMENDGEELAVQEKEIA
jgi:hypothetical protein